VPLSGPLLFATSALCPVMKHMYPEWNITCNYLS
jgi:hypothetical protein